MTPPTSVSSKSSAGLGEFYNKNAFHSNGNLPAQLRLPLYLPGYLTFHFKLSSSRAKITPDAKNPGTTDPTQFRSISLTPVVCKILETILKEELLSHLSQLSLLTTRQHGFLPRQSTVTNLPSPEETVTRWLDKRDIVGIVYLDFAKAVDSVYHRLTKFKCYGISNDAPSKLVSTSPYRKWLRLQVEPPKVQF